MKIIISDEDLKQESKCRNLKIKDIKKLKEKFIEKMNDEASETGASYLEKFIEEIIIQIYEDDYEEKIICYKEENDNESE